MKKIIYLISKIIKKSKISSIKNSKIDKSSKVEANSSFDNSIMNKYSFCGYNCEISNCEIGSFVSIANNVIIGGGVHPMDWVGMSPVFYKGRDSVKKKFSTFERLSPKKTTIGNDVWIGNNVLIKQGVNIGHGAVIGMGTVITKDVESYSVVAGVPGRVIKKRFEDDVIKALLEIEWWNFSEDKLELYAVFIKKPKIFIEQYFKDYKL